MNIYIFLRVEFVVATQIHISVILQPFSRNAFLLISIFSHLFFLQSTIH
jgi:hypothetical protein